MCAAVPMSMEEWQFRMRAQKNEDRKNKTESKSMLSSYRGGVNESDRRLSSLKQEEREKKKLAEELNRNYRRSQVSGAADELDSKLKEIREQERMNKKLTAEYNHNYRMEADAVNISSPTKTTNHSLSEKIVPDVVAPSQQKKDPWENIAQGAVAGLAANFNTLSNISSHDSADEKKTETTPSKMIPPEQPVESQPLQQTTQYEASHDTGVADIMGQMQQDATTTEASNPFLQPENPVSQDNKTDPFQVLNDQNDATQQDPFAGMAAAPPSNDNGATDPFAMQQDTNTTTTAPAATFDNTNTTTTAPAATFDNDNPFLQQEQQDPASTDLIAVQQEQHAVEQQDYSTPPQPTAAPPMVVTPEQQPPKEVQQQEYEQQLQHENAPAGHDRPARLNVAFSFGLITMNAQPSFAGYIGAVEQIVRDTLSQNVQFSSSVSYDPVQFPLVVSASKDDTFVDLAGRSHVQRVLVKIVLPLLLNDNNMQQMVWNEMIHALKSSVQSGNFLNVALSQNN